MSRKNLIKQFELHANEYTKACILVNNAIGELKLGPTEPSRAFHLLLDIQFGTDAAAEVLKSLSMQALKASKKLKTKAY